MEINWLLIGVIGIIAACVYHGYRSGLVRMLFSVATFLITVVLVRFLAPVGVQMLKSNDDIYNKVKAPIEQMLDEKVDGKVKTEEVLDAYSVSPDVKSDILKAADGIGVSEFDIFTPEVKGITADCITLKVIDVIAYVGLFLFINIGLRILGVVLDHFTKLPGVRGVNKLAGMGAGVIEGIAFVWICFLIITIFPATEWGRWCFEKISESTVLSVLYAKNLFLIFL